MALAKFDRHQIARSAVQLGGARSLAAGLRPRGVDHAEVALCEEREPVLWAHLCLRRLEHEAPQMPRDL